MAPTDLRKHVYIPVPDIRELPKETLSKPELISGILVNLERSHQIIRCDQVYTPSQPIANKLHSNDFVEGAKVKPQVNLGNESSTSTTNKAAAKALLIANLSAPAPIQDPCVPQTSRAIPPPPSFIVPETPPPEVRLARETSRQLDQYDRFGKQVRNYYRDALARNENPADAARRRTSSGASTHPPPPQAPQPPAIMTSGFPRPTSSYGSSATGYGSATAGYGSVNASPADRMRGGPGSANASPWGGGSGSANASPRDPRATGDPRARGVNASPPRDPRRPPPPPR